MAEVAVSFAAQHIHEDSNTLISSVKTEAQGLGDDLKELEKSLVEAERTRPGMNNNEQIQGWFKDLRTIAYEAEDLVDSLVTDTDCTAFGSLMYPKRARRTSKKLRRYREQVKEIQRGLEKISPSSKQSKKAGLLSGALSLVMQTNNKKDVGDDDGFVVGIDDDVDMLVKMLVKTEEKKDGDGCLIDVVAIVGMGGSGKTRLAKNLYNHREVNNRFKYKAWISLSQDWDVSHEHLLLNKIVHYIKCSNNSTSNGSGGVRKLHRVASLPSYHNPDDDGDGNDEGVDDDDDDDGHLSSSVLKKKKVVLQRLLRKESCLVVLDDVWDWKPFRKILGELFQQQRSSTSKSTTPSPSSSTTTSKILFTSRCHPSPEDTHLNWLVHETKSLNEEDSWVLFQKAMPRSQNDKKLENNYPVLAKEMLRMCKGLPLAIIALGWLLTRKDSIEEWERVFYQLKGEQGSHLYGPINNILALSYNELPSYLKACFLYLGLLSEESTTVIPAGILKRMWIAEGFIKNQQARDETPEDAARRFLQELVNHTMVQVVTKTYTHKVNSFRLHDMMRDICIDIASNLDFLTLFPSSNDRLHSRRAAINLSRCSGALPNNAKLRSLVLSGKSSTGKQYGSRRNNNEQGIVDLALVFEKFKLLRVLEIKGIKTYDGSMPKEIGNLIHLRYLGIRSTNIQQLPRSIGKLHKLLTLDYCDVTLEKEIRLPNVFWRLERLRHLFLPNEMMSNIMVDMRLDTLRDLQTLWGIKGGDWMLREMSKLSVNLTKLYIQGISSEPQLKAVFDCNMIKKYDNLYALCLDWYGIPLESESLRNLSSKINLKKMRLMGRALDIPELPLKFPNSLWKLELYYTHIEEPETLNAIGDLPNLKFLGISKGSFTGRKWSITKENKFKCLEELKLSSLPNLEEWEIQSGTMSCLKKLSIISCTELKHLPQGLQSIKTLETLQILCMPPSFSRRFRDEDEQDFHIISHIPNIWVKDTCTHLF